MNNIVGFKDKKPTIGREVFIDPMARVFGDVYIGDYSAILYGAIIRGDDDRVYIGSKVAILENVIIEAPKGRPVEISDETIISHGAIIHGAKVGSRVLIGIGAIILDKSKIGENSIIGAGALIPPNKEIPPNSIVLGVPGKIIRNTTEEDINMITEELNTILEKAKDYKKIFK